jgi:hypothetical protein
MTVYGEIWLAVDSAHAGMKRQRGLGCQQGLRRAEGAARVGQPPRMRGRDYAS